MDTHIAKLTIAYLIVGFLIIALVKLRQRPEKRGLGINKIALYLFLIVFVAYVFPLFVFMLFRFYKVVVIQKYTMYQFKEYAYPVLFDEFNGYYLEVWNRIRNLFR
jgi:hypothetical protein